MNIRYCPECGEEFQPHIVRCSDCGALLEDRDEDDDPPHAAPEALEPPGEAGGYTRVAEGLSASAAEAAAGRLAAAGIPLRVEAHRYGLRLSVQAADGALAATILEREGILPAPPDALARPVGSEGGPCPACGAAVAPGTAECPGCGLSLSGAVACPHCGANLSVSSEECPDCGKRP